MLPTLHAGLIGSAAIIPTLFLGRALVGWKSSPLTARTAAEPLPGIRPSTEMAIVALCGAVVLGLTAAYFDGEDWQRLQWLIEWTYLSVTAAGLLFMRYREHRQLGG